MILTSNCITCDKCGVPTEQTYGQSMITGELRWFETVSCRTCGPISEADGVGLPPELIRIEIMRKSGRWQAKLDREEKLAVVANVLKKCLGLSTTDAMASASAKDRSLWTGTKTEVEWISKNLAAVGIPARIFPEREDHRDSKG